MTVKSQLNLMRLLKQGPEFIETNDSNKTLVRRTLLCEAKYWKIKNYSWARGNLGGQTAAQLWIRRDLEIETKY